MNSWPSAVNIADYIHHIIIRVVSVIHLNSSALHLCELVKTVHCPFVKVSHHGSAGHHGSYIKIVHCTVCKLFRRDVLVHLQRPDPLVRWQLQNQVGFCHLQTHEVQVAVVI